jgi:hypothetical protein
MNDSLCSSIVVLVRTGGRNIVRAFCCIYIYGRMSFFRYKIKSTEHPRIIASTQTSMLKTVVCAEAAAAVLAAGG